MIEYSAWLNYQCCCLPIGAFCCLICSGGFLNRPLKILQIQDIYGKMSIASREAQGMDCNGGGLGWRRIRDGAV